MDYWPGSGHVHTNTHKRCVKYASKDIKLFIKHDIIHISRANTKVWLSMSLGQLT